MHEHRFDRRLPLIWRPTSFSPGLPPSLLIENVSDPLLVSTRSVLPEAFPIKTSDYTSMWIVSGWPTSRDSHAFPLLHQSSASNAIQAGSDTSQLVFINWL